MPYDAAIDKLTASLEAAKASIDPTAKAGNSGQAAVASLQAELTLTLTPTLTLILTRTRP